jgi:hypothetical protein
LAAANHEEIIELPLRIGTTSVLGVRLGAMAIGKSLALVLSGSLLASGCGGRTQSDELLETSEFGGVGPLGGTTAFGGYATGGRPTGGYATGGFSYGGFVTGGRPTGGYSTGGYSYGGYATGGSSFGGYPTGGRGGAGGTCPTWAGCGVTFGGSGGYSTVGGAGGTTPIPTCVPGASIPCACTDGSSGAQICQADGTYAACKCALSELRSKIVGYWWGTRTTTWDGAQTVKMQFRADGTYSAFCGSSSCIAMYWGTDLDNPQKRYSIDYVNESGVGFGQIVIYFDVSSTIPGRLSDIAFDASGNGLTFAVWNGTYGPLNFVLKRS